VKKNLIHFLGDEKIKKKKKLKIGLKKKNEKAFDDDKDIDTSEILGTSPRPSPKKNPLVTLIQLRNEPFESILGIILKGSRRKRHGKENEEEIVIQFQASQQLAQKIIQRSIDLKRKLQKLLDRSI